MTAFASISVVTGALFFGGIGLAIRAHLATRSAVRVRARIVGGTTNTIDLDRNGIGPRVTRFDVDVPRGDGRHVRVRLRHGIGESVIAKLVDAARTIPVVHPAGHPERAQVDSDWARYLVPAYLCAPAVMWMILLGYVAIAF